MSRLDRRRAAALGRLAATYAGHLARRALRRDADGLAAFSALYSADRITAITAAEREQLPAHGDCVACGLCGFAAPRVGHLRPERLPSQLTRSLPDLWTARELDLGGLDWAAGEAVCPTGVPLGQVAGFVAARLAREGAQAPPPGRPPQLPGRATRARRHP